MKKLLVVGLILLSFQMKAQRSSEEKLMFNSVFKSLDRRAFSYSEFADTVKMFVIYKNELVYNKFESKTTIVLDLNTIILFMFRYDHFKLYEAKSIRDRGFIADLNFYDENKEITKTHQIYLVLDEKKKISVILIK